MAFVPRNRTTGSELESYLSCKGLEVENRTWVVGIIAERILVLPPSRFAWLEVRTSEMSSSHPWKLTIAIAVECSESANGEPRCDPPRGFSSNGAFRQGCSISSYHHHQPSKSTSRLPLTRLLPCFRMKDIHLGTDTPIVGGLDDPRRIAFFIGWCIPENDGD